MAITLGLSLGLMATGLVYSHSGATGIVKERMNAMKDMGDNAKLVADMFKGKTEFNRDTLMEAAENFSLHGSSMAEQFPDTKMSREGSKTEALPAIWEEWDSFNELITEFVDQSDALKLTIESTEDAGKLKKAFFQTTKSCSGCHKRFRQPKD